MDALRVWRESLAEEMSKNGASEERLARVNVLLDMGDDLPVDVQSEALPMRGVLWCCKAQAAKDSGDKVSFGELMGLCTHPCAQEGELLDALNGQLRAAEAWCSKARSAMSDKRPCSVLQGLVDDYADLGVECEEDMLLTFHIESGQMWREKAQKMLEGENCFLLGLRGMLREGDRIAMDLPEIGQLEAAIAKNEAMRKEKEKEKEAKKEAKKLSRKGGEESDSEESDEEEPENWACCDGCEKWRRLGTDSLPEGRSFFCLHVAKSCDDPEDEWDEEEEETAKYDSDGKTGGALGVDDMDDLPLSERKLFLPGALVFAQFAYYPFWPAVVRDPQSHRSNTELLKGLKHGMVLVEFFGTKNFACVDRRKTVPFNQHLDPNPKPVTSASFKKAVLAAANMQAKRQERLTAARDGAKASKKKSKREAAGDAAAEAELGRRKMQKSQKWLERDKATLQWERKRNEKKDSSSDDDDDDLTLGDLTKKRSRESDDSSSDSSQGEEEGGGKRVKREGDAIVKREKKPKSDKPRVKKEKGPGPKRPPPKPQKPSSSEGEKKKEGGLGLPKWFMELPAQWQGSYPDLCAVTDAEAKLKERISKTKNQDDIRREVRNMVTVSLLSALQSTGGGAAPTSQAEGGGMAATANLASKLEQAMWQVNGCGVNKEYRGQYRTAVMGLRSRAVLRSHILSGKMTPEAFAVKSKPNDLEEYAVAALAPPKPPAAAGKEVGAAVKIEGVAAQKPIVSKLSSIPKIPQKVMSVYTQKINPKP